MLPQAFFNVSTGDLGEVQVRVMCKQDGLWSATPIEAEEHHLVLIDNDSWGHDAS